MIQQRVLLTGGSGFIAGHCILQLLEQGYLVRTTARSLGREATVRSVLADAGMLKGDALSFVAADLTDDAGWVDAVAGVESVLHIASPVQPGHVENAEDLIVPARDGTLRVLRAARDASVRRVVLTSAFHAVSWGHPNDGHVFTEADWSDLEKPGLDAYTVSKTVAERAAWDFVRGEAGSLELTTMLPVAVMGPVMGHDVSGANKLVQRILNGDLPGFPNLFFPIVDVRDVRDVATAHIRAMTTPDAADQRFLLSNGPAIAMKEIGALIKARLGEAAAKVPTRNIPDVIVRAGAHFLQEMRAITPDLGYAKKTSNENARRMLGWEPRPPEMAIIAAAQSLVAKGLVTK